MNRYIDADDVANAIYHHFPSIRTMADARGIIEEAPSIDIVRCKECKHRPIKEDAGGENYGFNLIEPTEGDERCPCLVSDGWYSWMPQDDFYCGFGEREGE